MGIDEIIKYEQEIDLDVPVAELDEKQIKKQKNKNVVYVSQLNTTGFILEEIIEQKNADYADYAVAPETAKEKFLKLDKETGEVEIIDEIEIGGIYYRPLNSKLVESQTIYLPSGVEEYGSTSKLISEISDYLNFYFDVDDTMKKILPTYVLFTWVFDKFPFVPYLHFVGRTATGKTTAGETLVSICYKGIDATGATSQAAIFRVADEWGGTIFLDEFNADAKDQEMIAFLKSGVSDRAVLRVEAEGKNFKVVPYKVKSPKIFTSENVITDAGLQSRTLTIKMEASKRLLPLFKLSDYYTKGQVLRNKLLKWRLDNIYNNNIKLKDIEYGFKEFIHLDRRVQQIITPIYYLSDEEGKIRIQEFAKEQEIKTKEERLSSEEGSVFKLIYDYYIANGENPTLKSITESLNAQREELGYKTKRSEKSIASIVRTVLGLPIVMVGHDKTRTIIVDDNREKVEELVNYYGLDNSLLAVFSATAQSATTATLEDVKEIFSD
ncbi:MAG: hypothetical protein KatS3mg101_0998 [Patescibacteria group bacterium]|nr:MAG: hypothetical protein KatS3mg101_0998 [Patescibacteria group bacterium]